MRLSADINTNQLIGKDRLKIVSIYPGQPNDPAFAEAIQSYPDNWTLLAIPDADEYFDLRALPYIIYANDKGEIAAKNIRLDDLLKVTQILNSQP